MLWMLVRPRMLNEPAAKPLVTMFLFAALAIPVFYIPALFFGAKTNYTVVDTWRFWIIHLWVEGFFEFFATTVVALTFYQLGLTRRNVALRVIYLDAILYFARRPDRHRPPLVFHRAHQFQHGDVGDVLGAGSRAADPADAGCVGFRAHHARRLRGLRQDDRDSAQVDVLLPDGGGLLEFRRRRHVRFPDQLADRQLLRSRHPAHTEPRPCGA